jgi:hypothetical protein
VISGFDLEPLAKESRAAGHRAQKKTGQQMIAPGPILYEIIIKIRPASC